MAENKSAAYESIADYRDTHELSDENSEPVEIEVALQRPTTYFPVEKKLADQLKTTAAAKGVSSQALLTKWIQQKIEEEVVPKQ
jgi:metal-dependent HD superfamily phosphatase/phosphodiesterase